jgi:translation initiation factor 1
VRLDTNRRRGKAVTVITGVPLAAEALCDLAKRLKRECGAGGTVKDGDVEIQGDHRRAVVAALEGMGWKVKKD